jgi:hypothetical protein
LTQHVGTTIEVNDVPDAAANLKKARQHFYCFAVEDTLEELFEQTGLPRSPKVKQSNEFPEVERVAISKHRNGQPASGGRLYVNGQACTWTEKHTYSYSITCNAIEERLSRDHAVNDSALKSHIMYTIVAAWKKLKQEQKCELPGDEYLERKWGGAGWPTHSLPQPPYVEPHLPSSAAASSAMYHARTTHGTSAPTPRTPSSSSLRRAPAAPTPTFAQLLGSAWQQIRQRASVAADSPPTPDIERAPRSLLLGDLNLDSKINKLINHFSSTDSRQSQPAVNKICEFLKVIRV